MANNRRYKKKKRNTLDTSYNPPFEQSIMAEPITVLSFRAENTLSLLESGGIKTIGDMVKREEKDFYRIFTFKKRNLLDVKGALKAKKLFLKPTAVENEEANKNQESNNHPQPRQPREPKKRNENSQQQKTQNQKQQRPQRKPTPPVPADIYLKINKGGKWGFSDRSGKIVVVPLYDEVYNFKEDLCCVEKGELFGFINREGEEVVPIIYELALSFSEGLACVYKGGKCGYINSNNDIAVDFKFDAGTSFEEGSCRVKRDGKWGELKLEDTTQVRWIN